MLEVLDRLSEGEEVFLAPALLAWMLTRG